MEILNALWKPARRDLGPSGKFVLPIGLRLLVTAGFMGAALATGILGAFSWHSAQKVVAEDEWTAHTHQVMTTLEATLRQLVDVETGARGFALTGHESFLAPYVHGKDALNQDLPRLHLLLNDSAIAPSALQLLEDQAAARIQAASEIVAFRQSTGLPPGTSQLERGKALMDAARASIMKMEDAENESLQRRHRNNAAARRQTAWTVALGSGIGALFLVIAGVTIGQQIGIREKTQSQLRAVNAGLEQRVAERTAALRDSKNRLEGIINSAMDAIITVDEEQRIVLFNVAAEKMFGCKAAEVMGRPVEHFIPQRFRSIHRQHIRKFGESGASTTRRPCPLGERTGLRGDGEEFPIEASISKVTAEGKKLFTVVIRDVSEKQQAEASRLHLAAIIESTDSAVLSKDLNGVVTSWNRGAERLYGYRKDEIVGKHVSLLIPPEQHGEEIELLRQVSEGRLVRRAEVCRQHKDGHLVWVSLIISPLRDSSGNIVGASTIAHDISERKLMEHSLQESEERLRLFIRYAPAALAMFDRDMRYLQASRHWLADYGLRDRDVRGLCHYDILPDVSERWKEAHRRGLAGEVVREDNDHFERADGSLQWLRWEIRPWYEVNGQIGGIVIFAEDISERKKAEEALRESEQRFEVMANGIPQLAWMAEADGSIFWYNRRWYEYTGTNLEQMQGWGWQSVHDPEVLPTVLARWKDSIARGEAFEMEFPLRDAHGRFRAFLTRGLPLKDSQGRVVRWLGTNTDISERKEMEESLRDRERQVRALMDSTAEAILGYDKQGNCTFCNPAAVRLLGYESPSDLLAKNLHAMIHHSRPDGTPLAIEDCLLHQAVQAGRIFHSDDSVYWRKDGTCFSAECWSHPVFEDDKPVGSVLTFFDISERKEAQERMAVQAEELARQAEDLARSESALRAQSSLLQSVLDSLGEGLIAADTQANFFLWNPAAEKILGSGPANIPPDGWSQHYGIYLPDRVTFFPPDQLPLLRAVRGDSVTAEMFVRNGKRNGPAWIEASGRPLKSEDGTVRGGVVAFRDITESKSAAEKIQRLNDELEQRVLERTAQLEAANQELESFTYSVSHDLRAPLRHIGGFSKLLVEEFGAKLEPDAQHYLERITQGTKRMGQLVDELLNLARVGRQSLSLQPASLSPILLEALEELNPETEGRQIQWKIGNLPAIACDPPLIKQVFQNLVANALKYSRPRAYAVIEIGTSESNGEFAVFVRDNGVGFSMKYADKLFGVFQRLHRDEDFEGTGVGLATVKRIVQKHGGRVWAEGELDRGAAFYFTVRPVAEVWNTVETEPVGVQA